MSSRVPTRPDELTDRERYGETWAGVPIGVAGLIAGGGKPGALEGLETGLAWAVAKFLVWAGLAGSGVILKMDSGFGERGGRMIGVCLFVIDGTGVAAGAAWMEATGREKELEITNVPGTLAGVGWMVAAGEAAELGTIGDDNVIPGKAGLTAPKVTVLVVAAGVLLFKGM
jgi:hypothetical protein